MRVVDPGHDYRLQALDGGLPQRLRFVKREGALYPGNVGHYSGTTTQEAIRALVDRARYVGRQKACWQTTVCLWLMIVCVWLLEHRAARRAGRRAPGVRQALDGPLCPRRGHVGCDSEHDK